MKKTKTKPVRKVFRTFKKQFKLLDVVAEAEVQHFIENLVPIEILPNLQQIAGIVELLDPVVSVTFDRVILLQNKALVQGTVAKNIIYKNTENDVVYLEEDPILFGIDVDLPGLTPVFTTGKFNRAVLTSNVVEIGPDNQGTNGGINVQIYPTNIFTFQRLATIAFNGSATIIDQKIVLEFIIKVSKYIQQELEIPEPQPVFECRSIKICSDFERPVEEKHEKKHDDDHKWF